MPLKRNIRKISNLSLHPVAIYNKISVLNLIYKEPVGATIQRASEHNTDKTILQNKWHKEQKHHWYETDISFSHVPTGTVVQFWLVNWMEPKG